MTQKKFREAVGVFDDKDKLDEAIAELELKAFNRAQISVLGTKQSIEERFGKPVVKPVKLEDNPDTPRMAPVRPEEKGLAAGALISGGLFVGAIGALIAAGAAVSIPAVISAAAIGGGSGGLLVKVLGGHFDEHIEKQIKKGGLVLWVHILGPKREKIACDILEKYGAKHIHVHENK